MWKLISFEPCHNILNCFIYISISHLYARVNLIVLTKFHCLNCTIIIGKKFLSLQKPVFISTETFITLDNFTFITFTPLLFFAWETLVYPERWNFTLMRASNICSESWNCWKWFSHKIIYSIFPIFLTPEYSKFDPNIIGLYIKFPILLKPKKYMFVVTWTCVPSKKHWL